MACSSTQSPDIHACRLPSSAQLGLARLTVVPQFFHINTNLSHTPLGLPIVICAKRSKVAPCLSNNLILMFRIFVCCPTLRQTGDPYEAVCDGCKIACDGCVFTKPLLAPICTEVMTHSTSSGGRTTLETLSIERGYWRASNSSETILACYHADACLGGVTGASDYCRQGYEGPCKHDRQCLDGDCT